MSHISSAFPAFQQRLRNRDYFAALFTDALATEAPKGPKTSTMYVIRVTGGSIAGCYARVSRYGFTYHLSIDDAQRFFSANGAADAIAERNALNPDTEYRFAIVPVKVTETPATTAEKTVVETVPGKTGFVLKAGKGVPGANPIDAPATPFVSTVNPAVTGLTAGCFTYTSDIAEALVFKTANDAAAALSFRKAVAPELGLDFVIQPIDTPATTVRKKVLEHVPSSTTVELA